jgi:hypothetical protein
MKGRIIAVTKGDALTNYAKLKHACHDMGISYHTVTGYFRRNPKATSYTHKRTGITLTKTELL